MFAYFGVMDPNNLLCMAWKWQRGDVSRNTNGDLKAALERIKAKVFVMPIDEDMFSAARLSSGTKYDSQKRVSDDSKH